MLTPEESLKSAFNEKGELTRPLTGEEFLQVYSTLNEKDQELVRLVIQRFAKEKTMN